ncbi:hypothetical protein M434DRAFT_40465, partial [Hypoxylon sp. CO27-5]
DDDKITELMIRAAREGYQTVMETLLGTNEEKLNLAGSDGRTPISIAAQYGHDELVKRILDVKNVELERADQVGRTPMSYAAQYGRNVVLELLLRHEGNANSLDNVGRS